MTCMHIHYTSVASLVPRSHPACQCCTRNMGAWDIKAHGICFNRCCLLAQHSRVDESTQSSLVIRPLPAVHCFKTGSGLGMRLGRIMVVIGARHNFNYSYVLITIMIVTPFVPLKLMLCIYLFNDTPPRGVNLHVVTS